VFKDANVASFVWAWTSNTPQGPWQMVMNGTDPQTVATFHNQTDNQVAYADRRTVAKAIARYLLVTDSYTRRDVVSPVLRGEAPRPRIPYVGCGPSAGTPPPPGGAGHQGDWPPGRSRGNSLLAAVCCLPLKSPAPTATRLCAIAIKAGSLGILAWSGRRVSEPNQPSVTSRMASRKVRPNRSLGSSTAPSAHSFHAFTNTSRSSRARSITALTAVASHRRNV
jgi:hypothetical protein